MSVFVFLGLRVLHVFVAALWIGSTIFISTLLVPAVHASGASGGRGIAFGIGGSSGILAGIVGGAIVGRSARQVDELMREAAGLPDGPGKAALVQRGEPLWRRIRIGERLVIAFQMIALVLMAVGHYV